MRIKICGITRLEDALLAEALGAFAVGFVFAPGSRRRVDLEVARTISEALGPFVVRVGVFQNQGPEEVLRLAEQARLQVVQLHGQEPPEWAEAIGKHYPVIKAFSLTGPADSSWTDYPASALLLDGKAPGSGQAYPRDWARPLLETGKRVILSGGINPENLEEVLTLKPYAIDLASGVERAPGVKDEAKLRLLFAKAKGL
ncbi:phosphoribosylanthranilate isomerase [Thermus scotoductus]|uniref:N-(5'-phosphoribosyl)anthranilate isomerase n=1 Tax=Thermus scotoductus TaxID=37636 RepID=A0A430UZC0_THESC|nr:phosphoribosylanthranilate isomerase [Thermus scotoductus]RTG92296.1 N-(5'-phosphoribosyl)anthranilate isomerase [Thermus scotoductus]RTH00901.1 N-(5'-phosphoribosyl)anthranilate isomerase [Thermus scotoductus]RTH15601.1 N-(5'-phosphoribosyl)anthranilate isomerase [Thermus scotoductus]RTI01977.1 N-(5'-phosphoribosyl)anthranilate isomerase [Thermus scotoductus]RTI14904.1 N-(5'-phosphoribosyl)anthranilate isomerase [Thermus scotoductus]